MVEPADVFVGEVANDQTTAIGKIYTERCNTLRNEQLMTTNLLGWKIPSFLVFPTR
jgi:hypothetical protein